MSLCGQADEFIRSIEKRLHVDITNRGNQFKITGSQRDTKAASQVINILYASTAKHDINKHDVHLALQQFGDKPDHKDASHHHNDVIVAPEDSRSTKFNPHPSSYHVDKFQHNSKSYREYEKAYNHSDNIGGDEYAIHTRYLNVYPRGQHQIQYLKNIAEYDMNFAVGPAGTGKTFLAMAAAVDMLETKQVEKILLIRPVVEAGEHLGFLPGDLNQKIDPYLRPLFDALYAMLGHVEVHKLLEHNIIEAAPLAYMRGRTLNDSFVILDEAQNTTTLQMKMFLTRIGFGSKVVVTGDVTQIDLPSHFESGLNDAVRLLSGIPDICFNYFSSTDIVRHPTVQLIVDAYERQEEKKNHGDNN